MPSYRTKKVEDVVVGDRIEFGAVDEGYPSHAFEVTEIDASQEGTVGFVLGPDSRDGYVEYDRGTEIRVFALGVVR
jgi:hypothetical protein